MSWRTVVISRRAKLEYRLGYVVIRGEEEKKIFAEEISVLLIEHTGVSLTMGLLAEMSRRNVKVIFCDEKRNPHGELVPYYGAHNTSLRYREQLRWKKETKAKVWTCIVKEKILNQKKHLLSKKLNAESSLLQKYLDELVCNDSTNREGHAAKIYFPSIFGAGFSRDSDNVINVALNYGYGILLSVFNREVVAGGYFTQVGIFHRSGYNFFNLSSDIMEPFRILIDQIVSDLEIQKFDGEEKMKLIDVLNQKVKIKGKWQYVSSAISIYTKTVFEALNQDDPSALRFYENEL